MSEPLALTKKNADTILMWLALGLPLEVRYTTAHEWTPWNHEGWGVAETKDWFAVRERPDFHVRIAPQD